MNLSLEIKVGKLSEYKDQIFELMEKHWSETGLPNAKELRLDLDLDVYLDLENRDQHLGIGIFDGSTLIGYSSFMIYNHHQHKTVKFAQTDGFFVDPSRRGFKTFKAVCKMFNTAETILKEKYGVEYLYLGTNAQNDLKFLAECLKFTPASVMYIKRLK